MVHLVIGIIHNLEKTNNYFSVCIIQFDGNGVQKVKNDCYSEPLKISPTAFVSGNGDLFIGSRSSTNFI